MSESDASAAPSREQLEAVVRAGLGLAAEAPVQIREIEEHSNFNFVFRATLENRVVYLKMVPEQPKSFAAQIPRERVFSEAEAIRRFRALCGSQVRVPEVLFVDREAFAFAMSDVGEDHSVLLDVIDERFDLLAGQARSLGEALAAVHGGSRGQGPLRPPAELAVVRHIIFEGLMAPGAKALFPELWDEVGAAMQAEPPEGACLVHADLWGKNLLVKGSAPIAIVDFEGAYFGDPAFDLATVLAVSLIPALRQPTLVDDAVGFAEQFLTAYGDADGEPGRAAVTRSLRYTGTLVAARGFGPFPYEMTDGARDRLAGLARELTVDSPQDLAAFAATVRRHAGP